MVEPCAQGNLLDDLRDAQLENERLRESVRRLEESISVMAAARLHGRSVLVLDGRSSQIGSAELELYMPAGIRIRGRAYVSDVKMTRDFAGEEFEVTLKVVPNA